MSSKQVKSDTRIREYISNIVRTHQNLSDDDIANAADKIVELNPEKAATLLTIINKKNYIGRISYKFNDNFDKAINNSANFNRLISRMSVEPHGVDDLTRSEKTKLITLKQRSIKIVQYELMEILGKKLDLKFDKVEHAISRVLNKLPDTIYVKVDKGDYQQVIPIRVNQAIRDLSRRRVQSVDGVSLSPETIDYLRKKYKIEIQFYANSNKYNRSANYR